MTQEQRKHVEEMLIDMIENVPPISFRMDGEPKRVSSEGMRAAAEITHALIALQKSAADFPQTARGNNMAGGKTFSVEKIRAMARQAFQGTGHAPVRGITIEAPEKPHGGTAEITITIHADTSELDEAIAKAERLEEILRGVENAKRTVNDGFAGSGE